IKVAERFAPNIRPTIPGKLYVLDTDPWQMRCVATIEDVIKVAERFAPNIRPTIPGKLYVLDTDPWQMRCVA
ncbi:hypothetical protein CJ430_31570, partial [Klebsiella pneumoniae]